MTSRTDVIDVAGGQPAKGASARERALRFNRGMIGLGLVALAVILLLPN